MMIFASEEEKKQKCAFISSNSFRFELTMLYFSLLKKNGRTNTTHIDKKRRKRKKLRGKIPFPHNMTARRQCPLVVICEDECDGMLIGLQYAIDCVYERYVCNLVGADTPAIVSPFSSVTLIMSEAALAAKEAITRGAERSSNGLLRVVVLETGKVPTLLAHSFQVKVPEKGGRAGGGGGGESSVDMRFQLLINCSKQFHDTIPMEADLGSMVIDLWQYSSVGEPRIPREAVFLSLTQKIELGIMNNTNLWSQRKYLSSSEAGALQANLLRNGAAASVTLLEAIKATSEEVRSMQLQQTLLCAALIVGSFVTAYLMKK